MKAKTYTALLTGLGALVLSTLLFAHHSFTATYFEDREVTIEGELSAFMLRNPHAILHVMAPDDSGEMRRWIIEWGSASVLRNDVDRDTLKAGDKVVVTGNPGREEGGYRILLRSIKRPSDGWEWSGQFD